MQLQGQKLHPLMGFYRATLGNARALQLDSVIGNFVPGKEADFVVLDWAASEAQRLRQGRSQTINDLLFALMMLGDEVNVLRTYILAEQVFNRAQ